MNAEIEQVIRCAVQRVNELLPVNEMLSEDASTVLLGRDGQLDSMGFVNFVVALEEEIDRQFGRQVSLTDALTSGEGVRTIGDLHDLLVRVLQTQKPASG